MNATTLARNIVRQLIEAEICDFVISPGSRNAPLTIALYEAEQAGLVNLYVRIDERGAAFFALGLAKASDKYVGVICTSGTAAANFHPAMLEAYHSQNKLLAITADRPASLRRTGANQTTLQVDLLSPIPTLDCAEIMDVTHLLDGGPVHLNVQFEEPLLSDDRTEWLLGLKPEATALTPENSQESRGTFVPKPKGMVIVGHDRAGFSRDQIGDFAKSLGWPLIAEDPLSFPESISHASLFLSDPTIRKAYQPDQIVVIGRTTLSRSINAFISQAPELIVIDPRTAHIDTNRTADQIFESLPNVADSEFSGELTQQWLLQWHELSKLAVANVQVNWSEQLAIATISRLIPDGSALFVASSRPIRDIEAFAAPRSGIDTFANRGLAGIDGNLACAFGISEKYDRSFAILGDVTFLHDVSALANPSTSNLTVFIIDNNGGGIFNTLPQSSVDGFEKIFGTPHNLNLERVIAGFGFEVSKVKSVSDLDHSIVHYQTGLHFVIVEVPDRQVNAANLLFVTQSLVNALRIGSNLA